MKKSSVHNFFYETHILGMDQRIFYCRVQQSKSRALKGFLSRVMAKKLYTGHQCLSSQFFEKQSVLYVHSIAQRLMFLYMLCITPCGLPRYWIYRERRPRMKRLGISRGRDHPTKIAMEGTPCKFSVFVHTTFLYNTPGCGPHTSTQGRKKAHSCVSLCAAWHTELS